jgi:hypothetical protein
MNNIVQKCLESISITTNVDKLYYDWEDSTYCVTFERNGKKCEFRFCRRFFGIISDIYLITNHDIISEDLISKDEFRLLKKSFNDKIESINEDKLNEIFPEIERNNKLEKILND